jgi:hypothetical protein
MTTGAGGKRWAKMIAAAGSNIPIITETGDVNHPINIGEIGLFSEKLIIIASITKKKTDINRAPATWYKPTRSDSKCNTLEFTGERS